MHLNMLCKVTVGSSVDPGAEHLVICCAALR